MRERGDADDARDDRASTRAVAHLGNDVATSRCDEAM